MALSKSELRAQLKQARLAMPEEAHRLASQAIVERLKPALDWSQAKSLHYFEPIAGLLEPDIRGFITDLEDIYPDLPMSVPRLIGDTWQLVSTRGGEPLTKFDVIIVPMLGFDPKTLHRIGYGGGYYDKFLATQPQARKIGVCFEQGKTKIPATSQDIPLNIILTEEHLYHV